MKHLIDTSTITMEVSVSEAELRNRLEAEVLQGLGLLDPDGKVVPGVTGIKVLRGEGGRGGYRVQVARNMTLAAAPRLPA